MRRFVARLLMLVLATWSVSSTTALADGSSTTDYTETGGASPLGVQVTAHSGSQGADASGLVHWLTSAPPPTIGLNLPPSNEVAGSRDVPSPSAASGVNGPSLPPTVRGGMPDAQSSSSDSASADGVFRAAATGPLPGETLVPVLISTAISPGGHMGPSGYGVVVLRPSPALQSTPGTAAIPNLPTAPIRADPNAVAQDLRAHIGLPAVQITITPEIGLVGLPDDAWLAGYGGQDLVASRTVDIPPVVGPNIPLILVPANDPRRQGQRFTVSVKLTPTGYTWDFGDGSQAVTTTSLGAPYPQRSAIQHTYQRSSLGQPGGVAIAVTAHFAASYQVDGGGWQSLPPVDHTYRRTQEVQQVQTVLVAGH